MIVAQRLAQREIAWRELDTLLVQLANRRELSAEQVLRLGELYRSTCTDLMLAEDHDLPRETVAHLQALVARAHNLVYRASGFQFRDLGRALFYSAPRRLRHDPALRLATLVFWGVFLFSASLSAGRPDFARRVLSAQYLESIDHMYAEPVSAPRHDGLEPQRHRNDWLLHPAQHNDRLPVFRLGNCLWSGKSLPALLERAHLRNAVRLHDNQTRTTRISSSSSLRTPLLSSRPSSSPAPQGLRLGWGLVDTQGQSRIASLRREAANSLPAVGVAVVLFVLAALVEGYVSASPLPYWAKAAVAISSAACIIAFLTLGGRGESAPAAGMANRTAARSSRRALADERVNQSEEPVHAG